MATLKNLHRCIRISYMFVIVLLISGIQSARCHKPGYTVLVQLPVESREENPNEVPSVRATRGPCSCIDEICKCCTGYYFSALSERGCVNIGYDPDEFAFSVGISMNGKTVYKNSISGKNPTPVCVPLPRFQALKMCVKFTNVYLTGRNIHACIDMEANFRKATLFKFSFDCMRLGANGVALLKPEDGGGLPDGASTGGALSGVLEGDTDYDELDDDEYDEEVAGGSTSSTTVIPKSTTTSKRPNNASQAAGIDSTTQKTTLSTISKRPNNASQAASIDSTRTTQETTQATISQLSNNVSPSASIVNTTQETTPTTADKRHTNVTLSANIDSTTQKTNVHVATHEKLNAVSDVPVLNTTNKKNRDSKQKLDDL